MNIYYVLCYPLVSTSPLLCTRVPGQVVRFQGTVRAEIQHSERPCGERDYRPGDHYVPLTQTGLIQTTGNSQRPAVTLPLTQPQTIPLSLQGKDSPPSPDQASLPLPAPAARGSYPHTHLPWRALPSLPTPSLAFQMWTFYGGSPASPEQLSPGPCLSVGQRQRKGGGLLLFLQEGPEARAICLCLLRPARGGGERRRRGADEGKGKR